MRSGIMVEGSLVADTLLAPLDRVRRYLRALLVLQAVNLGLTGIVLVGVWCCR